VYVFTQEKEGGFADADSQRRDDSVPDLQKVLAKRKGFALAKAAHGADLILEVTLSGKVNARTTETRRRTSILGPAYETHTQTTSLSRAGCSAAIPILHRITRFS
jgi:hypothetical protein